MAVVVVVVVVHGGLWGGRLAVVGRHDDGGSRAFLGNSTCLFVLGRLVLSTRQWWKQDDVHVHFLAHTVLFLAQRGVLTHETTGTCMYRVYDSPQRTSSHPTPSCL